MTEQEYLDLSEEVFILASRRDNYNKDLIARFPFLKLPYVDPDRVYEFTWLDSMPDGWRLAFGIQMCEEIQAIIERDNLEEYTVEEIKEKYGELRWYDYNGSKEVDEIINKYMELSRKTCICCGAPATKITKGWIMPVCDKCYEKC